MSRAVKRKTKPADGKGVGSIGLVSLGIINVVAVVWCGVEASEWLRVHYFKVWAITYPLQIATIVAATFATAWCLSK